MLRFKSFSALLLTGCSLAGCATDGNGDVRSAWDANRTLSSENQPVVERTNYVLDLAASGNGLPSGEADRLVAWFDSLQLRYGDRVFLEDAYASGGVRSDVANIAGYYGLILSEGAPISAGSVNPGSVRVIVTRASASVPGCPNWRQGGLTGAVVSTESNFGCATNSNLAAMIANPDDLALGRENMPTGDPRTATKAIKSYRDAAPSGAGGVVKAESTK